MTEDALKSARDRLLGVLNYDTEAAAHAIEAVAEALRRIAGEGGGSRYVLLSMHQSPGHKLSMHTPEICQIESEKVHRKRA